VRLIALSLDQVAPPGCSLSHSDGGMCMWLTLPAHVDAHAVLVAARKRGVSFKPGDLFSSKEGSRAFRNHCRIVVAHYPEETLTRGLSILCDVVKDCTGAPALGMTAPFTTQETAPFTAQGERNHRSQLSAPEELEFEACSMGL
jgi:2-aminoadipate transaminase